jgi:anti-anti-sigma factor
MSDLLSIAVREERDGAVVAATGELDLSTCSQLAEALAGLRSPRWVVVDLAACTFIDSSGLGVLVRYANQSTESGTTLTIRINEQLRRIFDITNLAGKFNLETDRGDHRAGP